MDSATKLATQQWVRKLRATPLLSLGCLLLALIALWLWLRGARFYALPLAQRVEHPDYAHLSPSRAVGKGYGVTGLGLLLFNLAYLLRKRVPHWPMGRMRVWLDLHVLTGLGAAVFAAYHSAFQARSPTALVTTAALLITVVSGVVGRFFHFLGHGNSARLRERLAVLDGLVPGVQRYLSAQLSVRIARLAPRGDGLVHALPLLARGRAEAATLRSLLRRGCSPALRSLASLERPYAARVLADVERLAARELYAIAGRALLRAWRPWHRLCALTVIGGVAVHVAIAQFYGYL